MIAGRVPNPEHAAKLARWVAMLADLLELVDDHPGLLPEIVAGLRIAAVRAAQDAELAELGVEPVDDRLHVVEACTLGRPTLGVHRRQRPGGER